MLQMGVPATCFFYVVMAVINVWCSHLLIDVNEYTRRNVHSFLDLHHSRPSTLTNRSATTMPSSFIT